MVRVVARASAKLTPALAALALLPAGCGVKEEERAGPAGGEPAPGLGAPATATKDTVRLTAGDSIELAADVAGAAYPATSDASRPAAVTLVDVNDWQGAVAGSVLAGDRVSAPLLYTDGGVPGATRAAIDELQPTGAELLGGVRAIRIGPAAAVEGLQTRDIAGADPYERAAAIDRVHTTLLGRPAGHVMVVSGEQAPWAMPAAAWAARAGHPVLFTRAADLPEPTIDALRAHEKPDVYLLGPNTVISQAVEKRLRGLAERVTRIQGATPVENAVEFARFTRATFGWGYVTPGHNFVVGSQTRPADAGAAAALGSNGIFAPLLLVDRADPLPPAVEEYLLDVQPGYRSDPARGVFNRVFVLGDEELVSAGAQGRLDEITKLVPVSVEGSEGG